MITFSQLKPGDVFKIAGNKEQVFVKVAGCFLAINNVFNAVELNSGLPQYFYETNVIEYYSGKINLDKDKFVWMAKN